MALEHISYEVKSLLAAVLIPDWPPILVGDHAGVMVRFDGWINNVRLEAAMVHLRCLYAFLTGIEAHKADVIAMDYFKPSDGWQSPAYVIGRDAADQRRILDNINRRVHHIGQQRTEPFTWDDVVPHIPTVAEHFLVFVQDLAKFGHVDRAAWFDEAVVHARVCAALLSAP